MTTNILVSEPQRYASSLYLYLDARKLEQLSSGHKQIMSDTANAFIAFMPSMLAELENGVQQQQANTVAKLLHKIKASTGLVSKDSLYQEILSLERNAIRVTSADFAQNVRVLVSRIRTLTEELRLFVSRL